MDKQAIIDIIKANPDMDHDAVKTQALSAGVEEALFEEAWKEAHASDSAAAPVGSKAEAPSPAKVGTANVRVGYCIKSALGFLRSHLGIFLGILVVLFVPLSLLIDFFLGDYLNSLSFSISLNGGGNESVLVSIFSLIVSLATLSMVKMQVENQPITFGSALGAGFKKFFPGLGTSILLGMSLFFLYLLLFVPGVIYSVFWAFTIAIVVFKDKMAMAAMNESKALVKGRWASTFGALFLIVLGAGFISFVYGFGIEYINALVPTFIPASALVYWNAVYVVLAEVVTIFGILVNAYFYLEMERTKSAVASPVSPGPAPAK